MLLPVYKPLGASTHQLAKQAGEEFDEKATHTGTLDPMAEGVVIVLTGVDRFQKAELSSWKKTYQFSVLWGVSTDSEDLLGLQQKSMYFEEQDFSQITDFVPDFLARIMQQKSQRIPEFSAKRVDGTSYFENAKEGKENPNYTQDISITSLTFDGHRTISKPDLVEYVNSSIAKVKGDFRQSSILDQWETFLSATAVSSFLITDHTCVCSKRTYIRAIVRDLSKLMEIPATTFSILRSQNGQYGVGDCICFIQS